MADDIETTLCIEAEAGKTFDEETIAAIREDIAKLNGGDIDVQIEMKDDDLLEAEITTQYWYFPTKKLQEIAKKYRVHIHALARKYDVDHIEVVCINPNGKVVQEDEYRI